jgi:Peptidase family M23
LPDWPVRLPGTAVIQFLCLMKNRRFTMMSTHAIAPFPFRFAVLAAALASLGLSAQATPSNDALPLPPMHSPFQAGENWRVGGLNGTGGSYFGEGMHRNRNPDAPYNAWNDYYSTDWNLVSGNNDGRPVYPVADGVVISRECDYTIGYGCNIVMEHGLGDDSQRFQTRYAHLKPDNIPLLEVGAYLYHWQQIGRVSNTGKDSNSMAPHLHLSAMSADRSSGSLKFASNCAMGVSSSRCDNGELYLTPQSRRITRMFNQPGTGGPQSVNLSDGLAVTSANRPTLYFSGLYNSSALGRTVNLYISNAHISGNPSDTNNITVTWYNQAGGVARIDNRTLALHQNIRIPAPGTKNVYSAVISAEPGKDIAAMAKIKEDYANTVGEYRSAYAAMEPISQPLATQVIPVWHRNNYGWNSAIRIFNPDNAPIRVDVQFKAVEVPDQPPVNCNKTYDIVRYQTQNVITDLVDCLPSGHYGTATVRAYYYDSVSGQETGPALVAASYEQWYEQAATKERSLIAASASQLALRDANGSRILYAPVIQNNNYGWLSGLAANRLEGSGNLLLDYFQSIGDNSVCGQQSNDGTWPFVKAPLFPAGSGCSHPVMAAKISAAADGVRHVSAQINQTNGLNASGYPAIGAPGKRIWIPLLQNGKDGNNNPLHTSGIQLQNTSASSAAQVTIIYYDDKGVGTTTQANIPANGFLTLPNAAHPFPANVVNAEIDSDIRLAAVVNIVTTNACVDCILSYVPGMRN